MGDDPWSQFESPDHDAHTELFHRGAAQAVPSHRCVLSGLGSGVGAGTGKPDGLGEGMIDGAGEGFIVGLVVGAGVGRMPALAEGWLLKTDVRGSVIKPALGYKKCWAQDLKHLDPG